MSVLCNVTYFLIDQKTVNTTTIFYPPNFTFLSKSLLFIYICIKIRV